jgi:hypothetical protein
MSAAGVAKDGTSRRRAIALVDTRMVTSMQTIQGGQA